MGSPVGFEELMQGLRRGCSSTWAASGASRGGAVPRLWGVSSTSPDSPQDPSLPSGGTYIHRVRVRYGETDQMGVAHHGSYIAYLEEARTEWMRALGTAYADLERAGVGLPVRSMSLRYRAAAHYEEELEVEIRVARLRPVAVTFGYRILRRGSGEVLVEAEVELACVDLSVRPLRPRPLPEGLHEALKAVAP